MSWQLFKDFICGALKIDVATGGINTTGTAVVGGIKTVSGLPTSDPADGTHTLWADPVTHAVFEGT